MGEGVHLNKSLYVDALRDGRITGDLTAFVRTSLSLIRQSAQANHQRLDALGGLYRTWRDRTTKYRRQSVIHKLVPLALTMPVFTVKDALRALAGSPVFQTVNAGIAELIELGLLRQQSPGGRMAERDRLFEAPAVIELFDPIREVSLGNPN
jgi:anaerobic glycerol-3-phosphate dehydrogenase